MTRYLKATIKFRTVFIFGWCGRHIFVPGIPRLPVSQFLAQKSRGALTYGAVSAS